MTVPPSPPPPADGSPSRRSQRVLCGVAVAALGLLVFRGYGSGLVTRPTDHLPAPTRHRVDLNAADKAELLQVPGIGPGLADAILTHRRDRGPFVAVDDVNAVRGVGGKTLDKLRPWLTVSDAAGPDGDAVTPQVERLERKPPPPPTPAAAPAPVASAKLRPGDTPVDVNAAVESELVRLPGVGPTLARRIVDARGFDRFKSPDDLRRVKGIGPKTLDALRPYVVCR